MKFRITKNHVDAFCVLIGVLGMGSLYFQVLRMPLMAAMLRVVPNAEKEGGSKSKKALMRQNYPIRYLLPAYIMLLIFFFVPTILNLIYAFTNWSAYSKTINFVGFSNFIELFKSGNLLRDLRITLIYALLVAIFQNTF